MTTIVICGGGAAGFFAAIHSQERYPKATVIILEKAAHCLTKVKISGGGRCNVTHACFDAQQLCDYYPRGYKALRSAFQRFQPADTVRWFEKHGVALKTERDGRIFPVSNRSQTIIDALVKRATELGIEIRVNCRITALLKQDRNFKISLLGQSDLYCQKLVLATGSNPVGYTWAKQFGQRIIPPIPSLFSFKVADKALQQLQGLAVKQVAVWVEGKKKTTAIGADTYDTLGIKWPCYY